MSLLPPDSDFMSISIEQRKLLASAIRIKILHMIAGTPRTAKQVADLLNETPGNIHYHIQRLYDGGLVELVETREVAGILEKYYKAKNTRFVPNTPPPNNQLCPGIKTQLLLTKEEVQQLAMELGELLEKWERILPRERTDNLLEVAVDIILQEVQGNPDGGQR